MKLDFCSDMTGGQTFHLWHGPKEIYTAQEALSVGPFSELAVGHL